VLHTPRNDRPSLALDLIEEMRPVIADASHTPSPPKARQSRKTVQSCR
jgi:hypothetical protein